MNPALNPDARRDGGASGVIELAKGDELHFSCHITLTDERALSLDFPKTATQIGTLDFANEAYDAEMCVVYGGIVGTKPTLSPAGSLAPYRRSRPWNSGSNLSTALARAA